MLDIAIIGGGPAALSAAINGVQRNKSVKVFGRNIESALLYYAAEVDNYLGMPHMSGKELMNTFYQHSIQKGVDFLECKVTQILSMGDYYMINAENEFFEAKAIIIATGINMSKTIPNESEFLGNGVSYCATCDGMLYKDKIVAVVAENKEAETDAKFLEDICQKVYYIPNYKNFKPFSDSIEIVQGKPVRVEAQQSIQGIVVGDKLIECEGIFFVKNTIPISSLIYGLETENGMIKVNGNMETNLPLVYAAGDCTGQPYQIAKAVGEGLVAALQAVKVIDSKKI